MSYRDRLDWMQFVRKTKHDNDLTNHVVVVYAENETELSGPIGLGAICNEN